MASVFRAVIVPEIMPEEFFESAEGQRRFVGTVDFTSERPRSLRRIVEDRRGGVMAVMLGG